MTPGGAVGKVVGFEEEPMTERRKITDEREARRCLAAVAKAGNRVGAWARANGIDGRSLNAWRINLAKRAAPEASRRVLAATAMVVQPRGRPALVELVPVPPAKAAARYVVHVGRLRVAVSDDFDPATLRRLVEVLRAC
jgi:hypothetical protein